jgi:hypothetical protein
MNLRKTIESAKALSDDPKEFYYLATRSNACVGDFFAVFGSFIQEDKYVETFNVFYSKIFEKTNMQRLCTQDVLARVKTLNTGKLEQIPDLKDAVDADGNITIYRGIHEYSRSNRAALSWALDRNVAEYFSIQNDVRKAPEVYKAKVKIADVITYIDRMMIRQTDVREVLVEYKNLQKIHGNKRVFRSLPE